MKPFSLRNLRHTIAILGITLFLTLLLLFIPGLQGFFTSATHFFIYRDDTLQNLLWKHDFTPSSDITLIRIDDESLNALQAGSNSRMFTISKKIYIDLIEKLESAGARAIGFDIVFQNKDPDEGAFRDTLEKYKNIVIATTAVNTCSELERDTLPPAIEIVSSGSVIPPQNEVSTGRSTDIYENCSGIPRSLYKNVTWGIADIGALADRRMGQYDIRGTPYASWKKDPIIDTFPLALYKKLKIITPVLEEGNVIAEVMGSIKRMFVGEWQDASSLGTHTTLSPFFGPPGSYQSISLKDIMKDATHVKSAGVLRPTFSGKIVIIGEHGTLIHDDALSPVTGTAMPGMETHANFLDGLIQSRIPHELSFSGLLFLITIIAGGMIIVYRSLPSRFTPLVALLALLFTIFMGRGLYGTGGLVMNIFPVLLASSLLSYPVTFIYEYFIVNREKRFIQSAFARYLDPEVVRTITENETPVTLSGERKDLTVFFSDIEGFTTISEKLVPQTLFTLMSAYLSTMTNILIEEKGTLDKYIGDAIMGFFGAPVDLPDHPYHAVNTAMRMRERLEGFNREFSYPEVGPIRFRVGIATGEVIVGNIGSQDRFNYTVLGDTVNLASRLEAIGKEYHNSITVGEEVYFATRDRFLFRRLDRIRVKGKEKPVTIYECVGRVTGESSTLPEMYREYERCLELYFTGNYFDAGICFEKNSKVDPTSYVMAKRCLDLINEKRTLPDGVWEMHTK